MKTERTKTTEELIIELLDQGRKPEEIRAVLPQTTETEQLILLITRLERERSKIPESSSAFQKAWDCVFVTPLPNNRYLSIEGGGRGSFFNQLTTLLMKTKFILGTAMAALIIAAATGGYLLIRQKNASLPGLNLLEQLSGSPEGVLFKAADISLEDPGALIEAIDSMANEELSNEDLYADDNLVSMDEAALNEIYNTYDQNQL